MSLTGEEVSLTLVWSIENYSCCLHQIGEELQSPLFGEDPLNKTGKKLYLYPGGRSDDSYVDVGLVRYGGEISEKWEFSILTSSGSSLMMPDGSVRREEVFGVRKSDFLPQDTLTVQCRFAGKEAKDLKEAEGPQEANDLKKTNDLEDTKDLKFKTLYARTRMGSERNSFTWSIQDFLELLPLQRISKRVKTTSKGLSTLTYAIISKSGPAFHDRIQMDFIISRCQCRMLSNFNVSVLDRDGHWIQFSEGSNFFQRSVSSFQSYRLSSFLTNDKLELDAERYITNGELKLRCEYLFYGIILSEEIENEPLKKSNFTSPSCDKQCMTETEHLESDINSHTVTASNSILHDLQSMYEEGLLSDFKLHAGTKTFPVHKAILCARSSVFRAIFITDINERGRDSLDIPDVDADTLQRMLLFIYSDRVEEDMQWYRASKLYIAAGKYGMEPLKRRCASIMKSSLCASNVFDITVMAEMHQDQDLMAGAHDFVIKNDGIIIGTEEWNNFQKNHGRLAFEIWNKLYSKKMKLSGFKVLCAFINIGILCWVISYYFQMRISF